MAKEELFEESHWREDERGKYMLEVAETFAGVKKVYGDAVSATKKLITAYMVYNPSEYVTVFWHVRPLADEYESVRVASSWAYSTSQPGERAFISELRKCEGIIIVHYWDEKEKSMRIKYRLYYSTDKMKKDWNKIIELIDEMPEVED